ncbi:hypothetical protein ACYSUO_23255 [Streptomyces sp. UC4497]
MKHPIRIMAAVAAATALAVTGAVSASGDSTDPEERVITVHAVDHRPSQTASDWVTYADHVVAVTATAEQESPPTASEIERGEGLIGRKVTLRTDDVLWSRPGVSKAPPNSWQRPSVGWQFHEGDTDNRIKMVKADSPRIEVGHSYLIAIAWEDVSCSGNGQWRGLGEGSTLPYDGDVIGQGELEGRVQSAAQALRAEAGEDPNRGLEEEMAGRTATDLVQELKAVQPASASAQMADASTAECG